MLAWSAAAWLVVRAAQTRASTVPLSRGRGAGHRLQREALRGAAATAGAGAAVSGRPLRSRPPADRAPAGAGRCSSRCRCLGWAPCRLPRPPLAPTRSGPRTAACGTRCSSSTECTGSARAHARRSGRRTRHRASGIPRHPPARRGARRRLACAPGRSWWRHSSSARSHSCWRPRRAGDAPRPRERNAAGAGNRRCAVWLLTGFVAFSVVGRLQAPVPGGVHPGDRCVARDRGGLGGPERPAPAALPERRLRSVSASRAPTASTCRATGLACGWSRPRSPWPRWPRCCALATGAAGSGRPAVAGALCMAALLVVPISQSLAVVRHHATDAAGLRFPPRELGGDRPLPAEPIRGRSRYEVATLNPYQAAP